MITFILVIVGGLNWLLAAFGYDLGMYLGAESSITKAIYILIGLSAIYLLFTHKKDCKACAGGMSA